MHMYDCLEGVKFTINREINRMHMLMRADLEETTSVGKQFHKSRKGVESD